LIVLFFKDNIEDVLDITGGVFGVLLMMTFPSLFVMLGRKKAKDLYEKNKFEVFTSFKYLP